VDFDMDDDVDILVANDFGLSYKPNQLYINDRENDSFDVVEEHSNLNVRINAMGIAKGDYDEDGDIDFYITNIAENVFFNNRLNPIYVDIANLRNVENSDGTSWGTVFADINNDTYLDLIVANGQVIQADHQNNENRLYLGNAHGTFDDASNTYNINSDFRCRGLSVGDLDNDGDLEMLFGVVADDRQNELYPLVYDNNSAASHTWLKIKPIGSESNRNAYGALIKIYFDGRELIQEVDGGSSYLSHSSNLVHFGLGLQESIDSLVIRWPGGNRTVYKDISPNTFYTIVDNGEVFINFNETITITEGDSLLLGDHYYNSPGIYNYYEEGEKGNYKRVVRLIVEDRTSHFNNELLFTISPNPIDQNSIISIINPKPSIAQLNLFDINGRMVKEIYNEEMMPGAFQYQFKDFITSLPSGIYFLSLIYNSEVRTLKIVHQ